MVPDQFSLDSFEERFHGSVVIKTTLAYNITRALNLVRVAVLIAAMG